MLDITRLIIQSKIDYGLPIYGKCSKTQLNSIKAPLNTAIRRSLRAFRTTPTENILAEGGFTSIETRTLFTRCGLLHKLAVNSSHILHKELQLLKIRKSDLSVQSGLSLLLKLARDLNLISSIQLNTKPKLPFWYLNQNIFINSLTSYKKDLTPPHVYQALYAEAVDNLRSDNWNFIFTDGSKQDDLASFAVVKEDGTIICNGIMTEHAGVFEAEAQAILSACDMLKNYAFKSVICTDSRSVFEALKSDTKSETIIKIQQTLMALQLKVKIMWIPGHAGINGNEFADQAAKNATKLPLASFLLLNKSLITKYARKEILKNENLAWNNYIHHYKQFNSTRKRISLPSSTIHHQLSKTRSLFV